MLSQMGIHPLHLSNLKSVGDTTFAHVYLWVSSFSIQYGGMMLVIGTLIWVIGWKFKVTGLSRWGVRVIVGVFAGECIIILGPQLYFSFMQLLNRI